MKVSIDASPIDAWFLHGLLITFDSCCYFSSVMFSASFVFPFPNTDETVSQPDHAWTKSKCCLNVFTFRTGILDTPSFLPSLLKEVNVKHVALPMVNKHHCDICVISHNGNMSPTCICHVESGFHNGAVCITRAIDSRIP